MKRINNLFGKLSLACTIVVFVFALPLVCAPQAHASGVVNPCTEANLVGAVSTGGLVTFNCGGPATITLAATITISANTTIDGTGQNVTISGGALVGVFIVPTGVKLHLNKLTIANGNNHLALGSGITINGGTVTVTNSTFSGNEGAIVNDGGTLTVTNSTFSGNTGEWGGGIYDSSLSATETTVTNSTFSGNSASVLNSSGGIYNAATLTLQNTILANSPSGGNCFNSGTFNDGGGNLVTDNTCGSIPASPDPLLGPLQYNGGRTQTMALGTGSPAIDNAVGANCPIRDQRGFPRPFSSACSMGAYELGILFKSFHINDDATYFTANSFAVSGTFTLGADNDPKIYPPNDVVQLRVGTFTIVTPAGSFGPTATGSFVYGGVPPSGVSFQMTIQPLGANSYAFRASASGQNIMAGTTSPVTVQLTVDDDGGTTKTPASANDD